MPAQKWFKFYGQEYLSDPKIERLTPTERSCWLTLLCIASLTDGKIRFLTVESLLNKSGVQFDPYHPEEWEKGLGILRKFQDLEMIQCSENGDIGLLHWDKRQETNLTVAERVRNFRERQKSKEVQHISDSVTIKVTDVTTDKSRVDKSRVNTTDKLFVLFWEEYPNKKAKPSARRAYNKITEKEHKLVMEGLTRWKESEQWMKDGGKFIPHPATFLNQQRYRDEVEAKPTGKHFEKF